MIYRNIQTEFESENYEEVVENIEETLLEDYVELLINEMTWNEIFDNLNDFYQEAILEEALTKAIEDNLEGIIEEDEEDE